MLCIVMNCDIIRWKEGGLFSMSEYIHKRHNVSILVYHSVCPAKYRRVIFDDSVDRVLVQTCEEISKVMK